MDEATKLRELLFGVVDSIEDGAALYDSNDRLLEFNQNYLQFFRLVEDLIKPGISFREIFEALAERGMYQGTEAEVQAWVDQRVALFEQGSRTKEFERTDGRWARIDYYKLKKGGTFVVTADITERKQTETDLVATKQQAEVASKAKSDFLASMNHELRTPLNAILGFAQVLRSAAGSLNDHQNRCIQHIEKSGRHLLGLVNEVLDLTRIEDG